mgnify:CR=1 FL=1|jgi:hypothetical protein|tara:strand:+ start:153 stop:422 length:270 start_codon:yes stop_codon:yes gene_type:complete
MAESETDRVIRQGGWFGPRESFDFVLSQLGPDRDEDGKIMIFGAAPCFGIGGQEVAVPGACQISLDGQRVSLAGQLNCTSYGLRNVTIY